MKIFYSYLLNRERSPERVIDALLNNEAGLVLHKSIKAAKRARHDDCYDGENTPGKLVKITLKTIDD